MDLAEGCARCVQAIAPRESFVARAIVTERLLKSLSVCEITGSYCIDLTGGALAYKKHGTVVFVDGERLRLRAEGYVIRELHDYKPFTDTITAIAETHLAHVPSEMRVGCALHAMTLGGRGSDASIAIAYGLPVRGYRRQLSTLCWCLIKHENETFQKIREASLGLKTEI